MELALGYFVISAVIAALGVSEDLNFHALMWITFSHLHADTTHHRDMCIQHNELTSPGLLASVCNLVLIN